MVSTINVRLSHSNYAGASPAIRATVDEAFEAVVGVFQSAGLRTAMSDEAEELVAAIHRYYERSAARQ